jgi:beta-1,2-mannobiose phosphorylase / 1,2-beta-oligomannan phosphorylase
MNYNIDKIILKPSDIDLQHSPLRRDIKEPTYVLGAFNPGLEKLENGNLIMMVRVAEALENQIENDQLKIIRWVNDKYKIESHPIEQFDTSDPRKFLATAYKHSKVYALTSISWLLPVELTEDGLSIVKIHYDKIIEPTKSYQEFGIEDPRITKIDDEYYMTVCAVSSERHSTVLYKSADGLNYQNLGMILDHQNKDMVIFPQKINNKFYALTRPLGDHYFFPQQDCKKLPGPAIQLSISPDLLHWRPCEDAFIQMCINSKINVKIGGGSPPVLTEKGWLILFHGVEEKGSVGIYRTFWALLNKNNPAIVEHIEINEAILEANSELTINTTEEKFVEDVVFTSGIHSLDDSYIVASGELDQYCRITHIPKNNF